MKEIIEQLRREKESLLIKVNKIDSAIANLESLEQPKLEGIKVSKDIARQIEKSRKHHPISEAKKAIKMVKTNAWKKPYKKRKDNKWSPEVFEFIKKNLNLSNRELTIEINKRFKMNTTEGSLGVRISMEGISRKEIKDKKKQDGPVKKHKCEECHENVWVAWYEGEQLCQDCLDLRKGKRKKKSEGMTNKEINKSMKDMGADEEAMLEEDPDNDLDMED